MIYKDYLSSRCKIEQKRQAALIQKAKGLTKQVSIHCNDFGLSGLTTQGGGRGIASEGVRSGRVDAAAMGGGSRQANIFRFSKYRKN